MAKQNVTFIERHVEKIVAGVCGAVLLGVCATYLVRSPNRVNVNGESLGPSEFYSQFKSKAEDLQHQMQRVVYTPNPDKAKKINEMLPNLKLIVNNLPNQLTVAFVAPNPPVPPMSGTQVDSVDLAQILPLEKPIGNPGRAVTNLPQPPVISADQGNVAPLTPVVGNERDTYWITLASSINRKGQREQFETAHYNQDRMSFKITGIVAERQMLLPSGEWSTAESIQAYGPISEPPTLTLQQIEGDTERTVPMDQLNTLQTFIQKIDTYPVQESLFLRPDFQRTLLAAGGWWWEWTIPRKLKGADMDLAKDIGVLYPDEILPKTTIKRPPPGGHAGPAINPTPPPRVAVAPRGGELGERGGAGRPLAAPAAAKPATPAEDPAVRKEVMANKSKAEKALEEENYLVARDLLQAVANSVGAPEAIKQQALKKLEEIKDDVAKAERDKLASDERRARQMEMNFGPDVDPIWLTDIGVSPGKTYRYRMRLMALNAYAGHPSYLKNPDDATKVALPGEWSEWSDPVPAKADKQVFAYKCDDNKSVQIEIFQWTKGDWKPAPATIGIGEPIVGKSGKELISYNGTIASIEPNRPYRERVSNKKDNSVTYKPPVMTQAVVMVNAKGEAEEHLVQEDADRRKIFNQQKTEERNRINSLKELQVTPDQIQRPVPMGPAMQNPMGPGPGREMMDRPPELGGRSRG